MGRNGLSSRGLLRVDADRLLLGEALLLGANSELELTRDLAGARVRNLELGGARLELNGVLRGLLGLLDLDSAFSREGKLRGEVEVHVELPLRLDADRGDTLGRLRAEVVLV